jgi:signal transduction histidine kinase
VNLGRLVDDLLEVNRVLKGKVPLNRRLTDVSDVVRRTVAALGDAGRLQRHGLKLDLQTVWVDADPVRLEQVVTNLLDNAVKYTPEHGTIDIALRAEGARAVLDVRDTGIGIPPTCCPGCSSPSSRAIPARATRTAVSASASPSSAA